MSRTSEIIQAAQGNMQRRGAHYESLPFPLRIWLSDLIQAADLLGPDMIHPTILDREQDIPIYPNQPITTNPAVTVEGEK